MRERRSRHWRLLAIDPTSQGFYFVVLEGGTTLVDWGCRKPPAPIRNPLCVEAAAGLVSRYQPNLLVLEDTASPGSRRCPRVKQLIAALRRSTDGSRMKCRQVCPRRAREFCAGRAGATKHEAAVALGSRFPDLGSRLPRKRKAWMTEDARANLFDALALAVTALEDRPGKQRRPRVREGPS